MTTKVHELLQEALTLSAEERAEFAARLLDSLDEAEDEGVEQAWDQEIERRIRETESRALETIPWSEARKRILALRNARRST